MFSNQEMPLRAIAQITGNSIEEITKLLKAGLLPSKERQSVLEYANSSYVRNVSVPAGGIPVIRLGKADVDNTYSPARKIGFHTSYTSTELLESVTKWWTINPQSLKGHEVLIVTHASVVVAAYRINNEKPFPYITYKTKAGGTKKQWDYQLSTLRTIPEIADDASAKTVPQSQWTKAEYDAVQMVGLRLRTKPGNPVVVL